MRQEVVRVQADCGLKLAYGLLRFAGGTQNYPQVATEQALFGACCDRLGMPVPIAQQPGQLMSYP